MRVAFCLLLLSACKAPIYVKNLDVTAIPAKEGSLAGTFAIKAINQTQVTVPIFGDQDGGGDNYRLAVRTWDPGSKTYLQRSQLCGGHNFAVLGVLSAADEPVYRKVPESTMEVVTVDHETGSYEALGHLQLWALRDLEDPYNSPLPTTRDAARGDFAAHIYDMDEDGREGFTFTVKSFGELNVFQRKTVNMYGVILGPDKAVGITTNTNETLTLSYTGSPLVDRQSEGSSRQHDNPKRSWFKEFRIAEGSTCDDILAMKDGLLNDDPPFDTTPDSEKKKKKN